eukprot:242850_1
MGNKHSRRLEKRVVNTKDLATYQSVVYGNNQLILQSKNSQNEFDDPCNLKYSNCTSAINIKRALTEYSKIITAKAISKENEPLTLMHELINNKLLDGRYTTLKLLDDFFHLKYNHNTMDSTIEFDKCYQFLTNNIRNICDIKHCKGYKHYSRDREKAMEEMIGTNNCNKVEYMYSYNLLCRIHSFFLHSYETNRLTKFEIDKIEQEINDSKEDYNDVSSLKKSKLMSEALNKKKFESKSNHSKFITTYNSTPLDYDYVAEILNESGVTIDNNRLQIEFNSLNEYNYNKEQLINDVCCAIGNTKDDSILTQLLSNNLGIKQYVQRQKIYDVILYRYISPEELDNINFTKVLLYNASILCPQFNTNDMKEICKKEYLNGFIFNKGTKQYKNSVTFSKLFKSISNWDRKKCAKIYVSMNKKWIDNKATCKNIVNKHTKNNEDTTSEPETMTYEEKQKYIHLFCTKTNAALENAEPFLMYAHWNIDDAAYKYYALSGDVSQLGEKFKKYCVDNKSDKSTSKKAIYNVGIKFWFWPPQNNQQRKMFIKSKYSNLKEETLSDHSKTLDVHHWVSLENECKTLVNAANIKKITSNGKNVEIYGLNNGDAFGVEHLIAVKLYTDYTTLNGKFCAAFRLNKIAANAYESIESLKDRNSKFAIMARLLIESVQSYGKLALTKKTYFRGINQQFLFKQFVARYHVPLSTTTDLVIAAGFAGINGLVLQLKTYDKTVSGFDVSVMSEFAREKETLFFGMDTILKMHSVYSIFDDKWQDYKRYINAIQEVLKIANGTISWYYKNNIKEIVGYLLPNMYRSKIRLPEYIQILLHFHLQHLPNNIIYDFNDLVNNYQWVKDIFVENVNERIPNVSNLCNLFKQCDHITVRMPQSLVDFNLKKFCRSVIEDTVNLSNKNIVIEFKCPTTPIASAIQTKFEQYGQRYTQLNLQTYCEENSVIILPSYVEETLNEETDEANLKTNVSNKPTEKSLLQHENKDGYQELLVTGLAKEYDVEYEIPLSVSELCHLYFGCFLYGELKSKVKTKNKNAILRTFEAFNRDDYQLWMNNYCNKIGVVVGHHITNGIQVQFGENQSEKIWYEPSCVSQVAGKYIKIDKRYLINDKVLFHKQAKQSEIKLSHNELHWMGQVGMVCKYEEKDVKKYNDHITVCFGDKYIIKSLPSECVKLSSTFFGHKTRQNAVENIVSFEQFVLGEKIKIKDDFSEVQSGFEIANRADCYEWMKSYCGKMGYIVRFHATNGICLEMSDRQTIWFEAQCIEKTNNTNDYKLVMPDDDFYAKYHKENRLLLGTKVKLNLHGHKYNGHTGRVGLHFPKDQTTDDAYDRVTIKFGNNVAQIFPDSLQVVKQYYEV